LEPGPEDYGISNKLAYEDAGSFYGYLNTIEPQRLLTIAVKLSLCSWKLYGMAE